MASELRVDKIIPSSGTSIGIGTASGTINFLGNSNITTTGSINAASATITGNLGVGGVLTYEDVTNVDSVGLITARSGINVSGGEVKVGTAVTVSSGGVITSGIVTATSFSGSGANLTGISVGTEVYDTWIYTAETNVYAAGNYLTSNWSRFGDNIGSAMTESSGVFSFPSTGYYRVTFTANFFERNSPDNIAYIYIQTTTDNNATAYVTRAASLQNITDRSGDTYTTCHAHILFDVTNLTTHKVRFFCGSDSNGDLRIAGASTYQQVYATFQKVGNT